MMILKKPTNKQKKTIKKPRHLQKKEKINKGKKKETPHRTHTFY